MTESHSHKHPTDHERDVKKDHHRGLPRETIRVRYRLITVFVAVAYLIPATGDFLEAGLGGLGGVDGDDGIRDDVHPDGQGAPCVADADEVDG